MGFTLEIADCLKLSLRLWPPIILGNLANALTKSIIMKRKEKYWTIAALIGITLAIPGVAHPFCLINHSSVFIHGQSLDSTSFEADIAPGGSVCCDDCLTDGRSIASLLVVTGYIPVSQNSQPGWNAECRFRLSAQGEAVVTGTESQITCIARNSQ